MTVTAEIISIGNEILLGETQDTNASWLCRSLTRSGFSVSRVQVLPDDFAAIRDGVRTAMERRPRLLITTGGLGPTDDDLTLSAIAAALGRALELNGAALIMIQETYKNLASRTYVADPALTASREKMAVLPTEAKPLSNTVGAAPGVLLDLGSTLLVALPGVPAEMRAIFNDQLSPPGGPLNSIYGTEAHLQCLVIVETQDESILSAVLRGVSAACPAVYVKSRATPFGPGVRLRILLSTRNPDAVKARLNLDAAVATLTDELARAGVGISQSAPVPPVSD